jgi:hypothetical protein
MSGNEAASDQLIADYLRELRVSAWNRGLPRAQSDLLLHEVRAKIDAALETSGTRDEEAVYGVLDRLGPPSAFVSQATDAPPSGARSVADQLFQPFRRLRDAYGWGLAEIGALLLLIVGPFLVWWIGPIFGIILVRAAASRWTVHATHRATNFVVALFAAQALIALGLFFYVLVVGGPFGEQLQIIFENYTTGGRGGLPLIPEFIGSQPLSPTEILLMSPPYVAGIASGIYLAFSPRHRPRPMV